MRLLLTSRRRFLAAAVLIMAAATVRLAPRLSIARGRRRGARVARAGGHAAVFRDDFLRYFTVASVGGKRMRPDELERL